MALSEFVQSVVSNEDTDGDVQAIARRVWNTLKHSVKREARKNVSIHLQESVFIRV